MLSFPVHTAFDYYNGYFQEDQREADVLFQWLHYLWTDGMIQHSRAGFLEKKKKGI